MLCDAKIHLKTKENKYLFFPSRSRKKHLNCLTKIQLFLHLNLVFFLHEFLQRLLFERFSMSLFSNSVIPVKIESPGSTGSKACKQLSFKMHLYCSHFRLGFLVIVCSSREQNGGSVAKHRTFERSRTLEQFKTWIYASLTESTAPLSA